MQVKSDLQAKERSIKVQIKDGINKDRRGTIIDTNGKSMKQGREYLVEFESGGNAWFSGSLLAEIK